MGRMVWEELARLCRFSASERALLSVSGALAMALGSHTALQCDNLSGLPNCVDVGTRTISLTRVYL